VVVAMPRHLPVIHYTICLKLIFKGKEKFGILKNFYVFGKKKTLYFDQFSSFWGKLCFLNTFFLSFGRK